MVVSPDKIAMVKQTEAELSLDGLVGYFTDVDLVITEGYKRGDKPKIEVFRPEAHPEPFCVGSEGLVALVTNAEIVADVPVFTLNAYRDVAAFIISRFLTGKGTSVK